MLIMNFKARNQNNSNFKYLRTTNIYTKRVKINNNQKKKPLVWFQVH